MSANATLDAAELTKQFEAVVGKKLDESRAEDKAAFEKFVTDKIEAAKQEMERKHAVHSLPGSDTEKHNEATRLGWRTVRVLPSQVKDGGAVELVAAALAAKK